MARSGKNKRKPQRQRYTKTELAKQRVWYNTPLAVRKVLYNWKSRRDRLTKIEDRRTFHPLGEQRPARSFNQDRHRLKVVQKIGSRISPLGMQVANWARIGFENPMKLLVCVRRKMRREVLHALKITGRSGYGKRHYNEYSSISC